MHKLSLFVVLFLLSSCGAIIDDLKSVGREPGFSDLVNPIEDENHKKITWPVDTHEEMMNQRRNPNSLWQPGARAFFRDQRARRVGDILKVSINIKDSAQLDNETEQKRSTASKLSFPHVFGLERKPKNITGKLFDQKNALGITGGDDNKGTGTISRKETIQTEIAAMVVQILPNGNLVIQGSQEIRVNYELRAISVAGIVRPEDISADNTINYDQIAEAKIAYGGRGTLSRVQQPRKGMQLLEILSPF